MAQDWFSREWPKMDENWFLDSVRISSKGTLDFAYLKNYGHNELHQEAAQAITLSLTLLISFGMRVCHTLLLTHHIHACKNLHLPWNFSRVRPGTSVRTAQLHKPIPKIASRSCIEGGISYHADITRYGRHGCRNLRLSRSGTQNWSHNHRHSNRWFAFILICYKVGPSALL